MREMFLSSIFVLALFISGCYTDDDYSYETENCTSVDYGGGQEYQLCCRLECHGEYDYDDYHEHCDQDYSCASSTSDACPPEVIDRYGYPDCTY